MLRAITVTILVSQLVASDLLNCYCGREGARTRIVNGRPVAQGKFPWIVALVADFGSGQLSQFCGATVISDRWILTAAHCVPNKQPHEVFVVKSQVNIENLRKENTLAVDRIWLHPEYKGPSAGFHDDIALLRLSKPVTFTSDFSPVCLPTPGMRNFDNLFNIGWGRTNYNEASSSQLLYIDTQQRHDCDSIYKGHSFWSKQICTHASGNGICKGDSGGPLLSRKSGSVMQVGINSWIIAGTCGEHPDVTTRVSDYLTEIYRVTSASNFCRNWIKGE